MQYRGHTLQGSYDGGFVYARKPTLPKTALAKVAKVARVSLIRLACLLRCVTWRVTQSWMDGMPLVCFFFLLISPPPVCILSSRHACTSAADLAETPDVPSRCCVGSAGSRDRPRQHGCHRQHVLHPEVVAAGGGHHPDEPAGEVNYCFSSRV